MPQQQAAVADQWPGIATGIFTATSGSSSSHGILKWPKPGLTSAAAAINGPTGPSGPPDVDSVFFDVEGGHSSNENRDAAIGTSYSGSGSKQQKHALFIEPLCHPDSNDLPTPSLLTSSVYEQDSTAAHGTAAGGGRGIYRPSVLLDTSIPAPASANSQQQQRSSFNEHGQTHHSTSSDSPSTGIQINRLNSRQSSLQLPETPAMYHSNSGSPWAGQSRSSRSSFNFGNSRPATVAGNSTDDAAGVAGRAVKSSSGISSSAAGKVYGTAWYLKSRDWDRVTHEVEHGSTWHRKSVYIQELDELHRFAQQLDQLTDPNTSSSSTSGYSSTAEAPMTALAAARQGLNSPAATKTLSAIKPEVLATNAWAMPNKGSLDETAAADAIVQHYKQLHHAAQQQVVINDKIRGTHALRAYKEFMQSKGYRQATSLQRLPTPTDEDMRRVKVKELQQLKRQQPPQSWHKHQQQLGSQRQQQQLRHEHQQQGRSAWCNADASAASAAIPSAAGANLFSSSSTAGAADAANGSSTDVVLCANQAVTAPSTSHLAGGATATVPKLNLAEVNRVTKQLSKLKHSCNPESGLEASDWHLLEALLTGGRQALATATRAAASSRSRSLSGGGVATSKVSNSSSSSSGADCSAQRGSSSSMPGGVSCGSKLPSTGAASLSSRESSNSRGGSSSSRLATVATSRDRWRPFSFRSGSSSGNQSLSTGSRKSSSSGGSRVQLDSGHVVAAGLKVDLDASHSSRPGTSSMFGSSYLTDRITRSAQNPRAAAAVDAVKGTSGTAADDCQTVQHAPGVVPEQPVFGTKHDAAKQQQLASDRDVLQRQTQHRQQQAPSTVDFFIATSAATATVEGDGSSDSQQMQHHSKQQQHQPDAAVEGNPPCDANDNFDPDSIDLQELASHSSEQPQQPETTGGRESWAVFMSGADSTSVKSAKLATRGDVPASVNTARSTDAKQMVAAGLQADGGALRNCQQAPEWQLSPRFNSARSSNSRELSGLASTGGAGRLSPYISPRVMEQVPMHINYTLSGSGSGAMTTRTASPTRLSGAGSSRSTPRSRG